MSKRYIVTLTAEERERLEALTRSGKVAARKMIHARILLKADVAAGGPGWPDERIADALAVSASTVRRIRLLFVEEGLALALDPRPAQRVPALKLDGAREAHLIALACGEAPEGRARWTLRLLAERFVALGHVETLSHETVRRTLKKTRAANVTGEVARFVRRAGGDVQQGGKQWRDGGADQRRRPNWNWRPSSSDAGRVLGRCG